MTPSASTVRAPRRGYTPGLTSENSEEEPVAELGPAELEGGGPPTPNRLSGHAATSTPLRSGSAQRSKEASSNLGPGAPQVSQPSQPLVAARSSGASRSSKTSRTSRTSKTSKTSEGSNTTATARDSPATFIRPHDSGIVAPEPITQPEMDHYLEAEMRDAIFCDPKFVEHFLTGDSVTLNAVVRRCKTIPQYGQFRGNFTTERDLYAPILGTLNAIKRAVHAQLQDDPPTTLFVDKSNVPIASDELDTSLIKPDLVLFEGETHHWETVKMPIEVKKEATHLKAGMKQLTRYARAVFAHQIHRRHLYAMVICGWAATFVRFDRSGILYSKPMDMSTDTTKFTKAFASLLLMTEEDFGYDTAFTTQPNDNHRLEYYVDLPASAFPPEQGPSAVAQSTPGGTTTNALTNPKLPTRKLKVMERLCHRKSIRGRATIVLRVREVIPRRPKPEPEPEPTKDGVDADEWNGIRTRGQKTQRQEQPQEAEEAEILGSRDYVLKLMWRESEKRSEGEVMEKLVGIYGLAQYLWHSDVFKSKCTCNKPKKKRCEQCPDATPDRDVVLACKNLTDLDIEVPNAGAGGEVEYSPVQTDEYSETYATCSKRIYCRLLMSTVGEPIWAAESPRRLLEAVLDAILGYWRLFNKGVLHRDISDGNVMMLHEDQQFDRREWKEERPTTDSTTDPRTSNSEERLQQYLERLGRDPRGALSDFDLHTTRSEMEKRFFGDTLAERNTPTPSATVEPRRSIRKGNSQPSSTPALRSNRGLKNIDFRTGTPTFMSSRVLNVPIGQPYKHHFLDDLESFFWLILWSTAAHLDPQVHKGAADAIDMINGLDQPNLKNICSHKESVLSRCGRFGGKTIRKQLASWGNTWASDPMIVSVIVDLGSFFDGIDRDDVDNSDYDPDIVFPCVIDRILKALGM